MLESHFNTTSITNKHTSQIPSHRNIVAIMRGHHHQSEPKMSLPGLGNASSSIPIEVAIVYMTWYINNYDSLLIELKNEASFHRNCRMLHGLGRSVALIHPCF